MRRMAAAPSHLAATFCSWRPLAPLSAACPLARSHYRAFEAACLFPRQVLLAVSIHRPTLRPTDPAASICECRPRFLLPLMPLASRQHAQTAFSRRIFLSCAHSLLLVRPPRAGRLISCFRLSRRTTVYCTHRVDRSFTPLHSISALSFSFRAQLCKPYRFSFSLLALTRSQAAVALFIPSVTCGNVYLFLKNEGFVLI